MNHAITIGGLLLAICILVGFLVAAVGVVEVLAGMMSDDPEAADNVQKRGCITLAIGTVLLLGCIFGLLR